MIGARAVWDLPEERAKDRGIRRASQAAPRETALAREAARRAYLRLGRPISADDIRAEAPELFEDLPPGKRANFMGAVWDRKVWRPVSRIKSKTKGGHSNDILTWELRGCDCDLLERPGTVPPCNEFRAQLYNPAFCLICEHVEECH